MLHALQCPFGPYRNQRHSAVSDTLAKTISKITGYDPFIEQFGPTTTSSDTHHPDDASTTNRADITWHTASGPVHLDVMITSAFTDAALAGIHACAVTPAFAAAQAEHFKRRKYAPHDVGPIIMEAHGRIGHETLNFLTKLMTTLPESEQQHMYHYGMQQLSKTLQMHNAKIIEAHARHHLQPHQRQTTG